MKNIIVYGGNGWIGSQFCEILKHKNKDYIKLNSRINENSQILKDIQLYNPTHIISFAGRTHGVIDGKSYSTIDYLEQPGKLKENIRDNLFEGAENTLLKCGVKENDIVRIDVPGSFELVYGCKKMLSTKIVNMYWGYTYIYIYIDVYIYVYIVHRY